MVRKILETKKHFWNLLTWNNFFLIGPTHSAIAFESTFVEKWGKPAKHTNIQTFGNYSIPVQKIQTLNKLMTSNHDSWIYELWFFFPQNFKVCLDLLKTDFENQNHKTINQGNIAFLKNPFKTAKFVECFCKKWHNNSSGNSYIFLNKIRLVLLFKIDKKFSDNPRCKKNFVPIHIINWL